MINSVSWILPLFNEAEYVKLAIPKTVGVLESLDLNYEIIVVDDASTDGSSSLIQEFALTNSRIKLLRHQRNRGLGAALRTGFQAVRSDIIIYTDIDLPFDFSLVADILPFIEEADIVHGYRVGSRESLKRVVYSSGYNFLVKKLFRFDITDINFSLDIIRRDVIGRLHLKSEASFIATELLAKAYYSGCRITQVRVPYIPRMYGRSHLSSLKNIFKILRELRKYYREILSFRRSAELVKKLIVSADDFALTSGVNKGIIKAFGEGIVTSASILATGKAFDEAVRLAQENKGLDIGVHLCLTEELPVLAASKIPTLIGRNGYFFPDWRHVISRLVFGKIDLAEVEAELEAQIKKVIDTGIVPTHIDFHQHIHLLPVILKIVIALANKYRIKSIRCPAEDVLANHISLTLSLKKMLLLIPLCRAKKEITRHGLKYADYFFGLGSSGKLDTRSLEAYLKNLKSGITEIVCHPGEDMNQGRYGHWGYSWGRELDALTDHCIKKTLDRYRIELVNYKTAYGQ